MLTLPTLHSLVAEEHGNKEGGFAIRGHVEHKLRACRRLAPGRPLAFVEILVHVSALGRVCFLPPHFRRARQRSFLFPKPVEHLNPPWLSPRFPCSSPTQPGWAPRPLPAPRADC